MVPAVVTYDGGVILEYRATTVGIRRVFLHTAHSKTERGTGRAENKRAGMRSCVWGVLRERWDRMAMDKV